MFGFRAATQRLCNRIAKSKSQRVSNAASPTATAAKIAHAIYFRENAQRPTSLRELHVMADVGQPEAMRALQELENSDMVKIDQDMNDALGSQIELTAQMRKRLEKILGKAPG